MYNISERFCNICQNGFYAILKPCLKFQTIETIQSMLPQWNDIKQKIYTTEKWLDKLHC